MLKSCIKSMKSKGHTFIIACESDKGRFFRSFKDARTYYKIINLYNHSHEMIIEDRGGRVVFDFDIHVKIPDEDRFKKHIELLIRRTIIKHYLKNVDTSRLRFVWMTSENPDKTSKHLTVKHAYFIRHWAKQLKQFYKLFREEYDRDPFDWIEGDDLIDHQVARKNGSLRMPLNSKLKGSRLEFDDKRFNFFDGLIQPVEPSLEQRLPLFKIPINIKPFMYEPSTKHVPQTLIDDLVGFQVGRRENNIIQLIRKHPSHCPLCLRKHENDNACLILKGNDILFYCYRGRSSLKMNKSDEDVENCFNELKDII